MLRTLGIVDACCRTASARARISRRMGGKPVLEWVARRVTECLQLDGVIILTSGARENLFVRGLAPPDVPVFVAAEEEPLACFAAALRQYPAVTGVRIGAAFPFLDPALLDRLVVTAESQPKLDYAGYRSRDGRPAALSPSGVYAEWFRAAALEQASRKARSAADREDVTRYLYSRPEQFSVHMIPVPEPIDREDVRLVVDIEEDWDHVLTIFDALGPDALDWQRIAELLDHQPVLRRRMAALNRAYAT
ncbi:MAG: NTP transferase domain-containing protein [Thermoguttaceae bacterium]